MAAQENSGVTILRSKGVRGNMKVSWCSKKWHRGEIESIVAQQKDGGLVKSKISWHNKRRQRGESKNIVTQQKKAAR
jgi:hypothetical protein